MSTSGAQRAEETEIGQARVHIQPFKNLSVTGCGSFTGMTAHTIVAFIAHCRQCTVNTYKSMFTLCLLRFSQGLRLRQIDMMADNIAASSATLTKMAKKVAEGLCHSG